MSVKQTVVAPGKWLSPEAAASYLRALEDVCPEGITSAGRTREEQQKLYDDWIKSGKKNPPSVAKPGTSRHESGLALDLPEPARAWMREHGAAYGWIKDLVENEPWHFEYQAARDQHKNRPPKEDPMALSDEDLDKIAERVWDKRNELSPVAAQIAGQPTMRARGALQQLLYIRRDVGEILTLLKRK